MSSGVGPELAKSSPNKLLELWTREGGFSVGEGTALGGSTWSREGVEEDSSSAFFSSSTTLELSICDQFEVVGNRDLLFVVCTCTGLL